MNRAEYAEYVQRIGPPRVVPCDIELGNSVIMFGGHHQYVWRCVSHDFRFDDLPYSLDGAPYRRIDRCPVSRLEEYRARSWEAAA